jgi:hypothetical protein
MGRGEKVNYTVDDLRRAVEETSSWRGVMRHLGFVTTNGYLGERLRREAEEAGINFGHFYKRRADWSNEEVADAVRNSSSWTEALLRLDAPANSFQIAKLKGRTHKLGLDRSHLGAAWQIEMAMPFRLDPDPLALRLAAPAIATAWFMRRGYGVSLPVEARPYDLIVEADRNLYRIQVKTAGSRDGNTYVARIGRTPKRDRQVIPYDPDDVDFFFLIDVDGNLYLVPTAELGGATRVSLSTLEHRKVAQ